MHGMRYVIENNSPIEAKALIGKSNFHIFNQSQSISPRRFWALLLSITNGGSAKQSLTRYIGMYYLSELEKRELILRWLFSKAFDQRHTEISKRRQENIGQWLLESQEFENWTNDTDSRLLWVHGLGECFYVQKSSEYLQVLTQHSWIRQNFYDVCY